MTPENLTACEEQVPRPERTGTIDGISSLAAKDHEALELLLKNGISPVERETWTYALRSVAPPMNPERAIIIASRLKQYGIRPEDLRELIDEYPRMGPGIPFPGFLPGTEEETAMVLGAMHAKLLDLTRMHDSTHPDHSAD